MRRQTTILLGLAAVFLAACGLIQTPSPLPTEVAAVTPPQVEIQLPASGGTYAEGDEITLQVEATDAGAGVARIVLFVDDARFAEAHAPNPGGQGAFLNNFVWTAEGIGPHELSVTAYRANGTASESDRILVAVFAPTVAPAPTEPPTDAPPTETSEPTAEPADVDSSQAADIGEAEDSVSAEGENDAPAILQALTVIGTNVRSGPGTSYPVLFTLLSGEPVEVVGRDYIQGWYQIRHYPDPDHPEAWVREGWIFWENLDIQGDAAALPVVQGGPPPVGGGPTPVDPNATAPPEVPTSPPEPLVALAAPIMGVGYEVCSNPNLLGPQVHYYDWLNGVADWWMEEQVGVPLEGGVTEGVRSQFRDPSNVNMGYGGYLHGRYGQTAVEMGGTWRVFSWSVGQSDIQVRGGRQYTLLAIFHPFIMIDQDGQEVWMSAENSPDWATELQWRWRVVGSEGNEIVDYWRNGTSLGTQTWELHAEGPHEYRFSFAVNRGDQVTVSIEFQNRWPVAVTRVWMHAMHCYEY